MAKAFLLSPKVSDTLILSASSSVSNAVVGNLLTSSPNSPWISQNSSPYITGHYNNFSKIADTIFFGYTNSQGLRSGEVMITPDKFRLRFANTFEDLILDPIFDSETENPDGVNMWAQDDLQAYLYPHRVWTFPEIEYKHVRVDFLWSNPLDSVRISRFIIGKRLEPLQSVQSKWSISGNEDVLEIQDYCGEEDARVIGSKRSKNVVWANLSEAEREEIYTCLLERGSSKDLLLAIEPMEGLYSMSRLHLGRIKHAHSFEQTMMSDIQDQHRFSVSLTISELAPIEMR